MKVGETYIIKDKAGYVINDINGYKPYRILLIEYLGDDTWKVFMTDSNGNKSKSLWNDLSGHYIYKYYVVEA